MTVGPSTWPRLHVTAAHCTGNAHGSAPLREMAEWAMEFTSTVEPPEPMRGLEVPEHVVRALNEGARPHVIVTLNGHRWRTRIAKLRGRYLVGLSNANRRAANVAIGEVVRVDVEVDAAPRIASVPPDLAMALRANPRASASFDALTDSQRREHIRQIENAKRPETRLRRIERAIEMLGATSRS